jgi:purine-cytosine permease-like protein
MVSMITTVIASILGAVVALLVGAAPSVAIAVGLGTLTAIVIVMSALGYRAFSQFGARLGSRFPTPPVDRR